MVSPERKREAVLHVRRALTVSERRACTTIRQPRATQRYRGRKRGKDVALVRNYDPRITSAVATRPRPRYTHSPVRMTSAPILSINIPTYNRIGYLKEALDALLPQVNADVEINISDNHSTDGTWAYLESLDGRVRRVRPPLGTNGNWNILSCLTLGTGQYTWIHCDDDIARLNAAENILQAIKQFENPPAITFQWDGYDADMNGFVNQTVEAQWRKCDRNEFLRVMSYKFTFASAIVLRRGCADLEYIKRHSPINLVPANIIFSTVGKHNQVVLSETPLLAARGNPGNGDYLTVFSRDIFHLFRMNRNLGYDRQVLEQSYIASLPTVMVHAATKFPLFLEGIWNVTRYSFKYKGFYTHVIPIIARRLLPDAAWRATFFFTKCVALCRRAFVVVNVKQ